MKFDFSKVGCEMHFLDSGSFSLWGLAKKWAAETGKSEWDYYSTDAIYEYMDEYATFIKTYRVAIDYYSNVDVIPHAELSWRNQCYLEKYHKLKPVPVVHYGSHVSWLEHYIECGYDPIALGGLVGSINTPGARQFLNDCFNIICNTPDRLPRVRVHGFGVTSYDVMRRFPWWSVDSSTWTKLGAFGDILVPHHRDGRFTFNEKPYVISCSEDSPDRKSQGKHILTLSKDEQAVLRKWLDYIGVALGLNKDGEKVKEGIVNNHSYRKAANIFFFEEMRKSLPDYPWPYRRTQRQGFGLDFGGRKKK